MYFLNFTNGHYSPTSLVEPEGLRPSRRVLSPPGVPSIDLSLMDLLCGRVHLVDG